MNALDTLHRIEQHRLIMVVRAPSAADARRAIAAARTGGVAVVEVTFTVPDALDVIRDLAADPDVIVGAGTVRTIEQASQAIEAGAQFLVSPGLVDAMIPLAAEAGVLMIPGTLTPSEAMRAAQLGASAIKLFPASSVGPEYLTALLAPLPDLKVIPSGGVSESNAGYWLRAGAVAVGMAGKLSPNREITPEVSAQITDQARRSVAAVRTAD